MSSADTLGGVAAKRDESVHQAAADLRIVSFCAGREGPDPVRSAVLSWRWGVLGWGVGWQPCAGPDVVCRPTPRRQYAAGLL